MEMTNFTVVSVVLRNNYWSRNLIGPYRFRVISPRNSTSFTRPFLTGRRARAGHETNPRARLLKHAIDHTHTSRQTSVASWEICVLSVSAQVRSKRQTSNVLCVLTGKTSIYIVLNAWPVLSHLMSWLLKLAFQLMNLISSALMSTLPVYHSFSITGI